MELIYVDNNATTRPAPQVFEAIKPYLTDLYFNPSSMYEPARSPAHAITRSRETVAKCIGAGDARQVLFTSCATESNNTALLGTAQANPGRRHVITTVVEHPSVLEVCKELERRGLQVTYLSVDRHGNLDITEFVKALRPDTLLVSIMHANNETGVIFPVEQLSRITKETDPAIIFHTDATQSMGKLPIDLQGDFQHVDLLSFSGHKLHAPKGVGALFIRKGTPCRPWMFGGHQEGGRRAGTENVAFIVGLATALDLAVSRREEDHLYLRSLRDRLESALAEQIPAMQINGQGAPRLPNTLNVACHYIEGESILYRLDEHGICASSGSACTSGSLDPSHVMLAMKVPFTAAHGSVRFSLSRYNTPQHVDRIIQVFPGIVASLRKLSPYWDHENDRPRKDASTLLGQNPGTH